MTASAFKCRLFVVSRVLVSLCTLSSLLAEKWEDVSNHPIPRRLQHQLVEFLRWHESARRDDVAHRFAALFRFFRDFRGGGVADLGVEQGRETAADVLEFLAALALDLEAFQDEFGGGIDGVGAPVHRVEQGRAYRWHHHDKIQLASLGHVGDRSVLPEHLETDLVEHLEHHRVDLARHDARARLHGRQQDFADAGARAGGEQAHVVRDARDLERQVAYRGGEALDVGGRLHLRGEVGGGADAFAGETRELGRGIHRIIRRGVEARASGAATEPDLAQCVARLLEALRAAAQYPRVGTELAADGGGHRVLQVRAAALDGVDLLLADARVFVGHGAYGLQQPR